MTDVLGRLSPSAWRGIQFPAASREYAFAHEQARHRYIFRDQQLIESLGRENPAYRYSIPFREDIAKGPYVNLFTVVYPQFLDACIDRDAGILDDVIHGPVQVKCASLRETTDPTRRDGIDVEVEWIVAPDDDFAREDLGANLSTIQGAKGVAGSLDRDIERIDWKQEIPPEATISVFDAASSVFNQLEVAANKPIAALNDALFRLEKVERSADRLMNVAGNVAAFPAKQKARRLQLAVLDIINQPEEPRRRARVHKVEQDIGPIALAAKLGTPIADLLKMNPHLQGEVVVSRGTLVSHFV